MMYIGDGIHGIHSFISHSILHDMHTDNLLQNMKKCTKVKDTFLQRHHLLSYAGRDLG